MKKTFILSALATVAFAAVAEPDLTLLKENLNPSAEIKSVTKSIVPNLYEVRINNDVIYLSEDGQKIINGDIYDLKEQFSYTERTRNDLRKTALAAVKDEDKIIYKAKDEKYKVTVFTDITCPYCTQLHQQMSDYNDKGITIEYLAFPRAGVGSKPQQEMQKIWCSADKAADFTAAEIDKKIPETACTGTQTIDQFMLGQEIGVNATPTLIFSNGEIRPGYVSADNLLKMLQANAEK